ncbi:hypothetical protein JCM10908_002088 [Rhodotorula pacifica]|uniref:uncharacterized protein n=1 Tax=Rhodotorula pacifica TaxID=1495444 RepID=UPI00316F378B
MASEVTASTSKANPTKGSRRRTSSVSTDQRSSRSPAAASSREGPSPTFVLPEYIPPEGSLKSRAPGRQNVACKGCRRRKVKCDGSRPSCMSCQVIYKEHCIYEVKATAADAAALQAEVERLNALLNTLKRANVVDREHLLSDIGSDSTNSPEIDRATTTSAPAAAEAREKHAKRSTPSAEDRASSGSGSESTSRDDELAAAMLSELSVAASGQVEHFGATSFLFRPAIGAQLSLPAVLGSPSSSHGGTLYTRDVPPDMREHLLETFFAWQTVHCHVYRPALMRDLDGGPFCNDFLINAIYAHASRFSDRNTAGNSPASPDSQQLQTPADFFLARAKDYLRTELDKPASVPTAQGLLILGGRESACGNHSQGFLYTSMALSMAIDLGVHVDGMKIHSLDALEFEARKRLFWSCYVVGVTTQEHFDLVLTAAAPRTVGQVNFFDQSEDDLPWVPYALSATYGLQDYPAYPLRTGMYFERMCQLSQIIEGILLELYAIRRRSKCGESTLTRFNTELDDWLYNLPPDLAVAADATHSPPPNRITLAMLFRATVILVNRPFSFGGWGPRIRVDEAVQARAKKRCQDAANEIARLLDLYDRTFRFRNMNWLLTYCAYTAATIHIFDLRARTPGTAIAATRKLEIILAALTSQTNVTPSVRKAVEIIRHLMANAPSSGETPALPPNPVGSKRTRFDDSLHPLHESTSAVPPAEGSELAEAELRLPNLAQNSSLLLPEFPEAGPLSWLGPSDNLDWLDSLEWLQNEALQ